MVRDDKYLVGDLRNMVGEYHLEMQNEYDPDHLPLEGGKK